MNPHCRIDFMIDIIEHEKDIRIPIKQMLIRNLKALDRELPREVGYEKKPGKIEQSDNQVVN